MKTLILNGSTRQNGDTAALLEAFCSHLQGEIKTVSWYDHIAPCVDCRFCKTYEGCMINDAMQDVYEYLEDCDNVVIASPIWFSSLSGPLLNIASRLQPLFCARFFRGEERTPTKQGVVILVGAQSGTEEMPLKNALTILRNADVRCESVIVVRSMNTDRIPASEDEAALTAAGEAAEELNRRCGLNAEA